MVRRNRGHIVGVSSVARFRGMPTRAAYCGSKAFLTAFLEGLRIDLHGTGVAFTCIQPGWVRTPLIDKNDFKMPFVVETQDAVERIGRAITARKREITFPLPISVAMRLVKWMPNAWLDRLGHRVRGR